METRIALASASGEPGSEIGIVPPAVAGMNLALAGIYFTAEPDMHIIVNL